MAGEIVRKSGLTAAWVKSARPKDKPYKLSDRDGLYLLIKPTGMLAIGRSILIEPWLPYCT